MYILGILLYLLLVPKSNIGLMSECHDAFDISSIAIPKGHNIAFYKFTIYI